LARDGRRIKGMKDFGADVLNELCSTFGEAHIEYRGLTYKCLEMPEENQALELESGGFGEAFSKSVKIAIGEMPILTADDAIRTVDIDTVLADSDKQPPNVGKRWRLNQKDMRLIDRRLNRPAGVWSLFFTSADR
jgi:hypothetical protein